MPQRIPKINEEQSTSFPRRSLRLHQKNQIKEEAATKNPKNEKRRRKVTSKKKTLKHQPQESQQKLSNSVSDSTRLSAKRSAQNNLSEQVGSDLLEQFSKKSATRRCKIANSNSKIASAAKTGKGKSNSSMFRTSIDCSTQQMGVSVELEKRVTRSSIRGKASENAECNSTQILDKRGLSVRAQPKKEANDKLEKKMPKKSEKHRQSNSTRIMNKRVPLNEVRSKLGLGSDLSHEFSSKLQNTSNNCAKTSSLDIDNRGQKHIGLKRKRNQVDKNNGIVKGWNPDQESALQRAYLATKPTPRFWKKVARRVPGKSAQECFDKVHSDHLSPPQIQPRTRARTNSSSSSSFSLSPTDFLKSPVLNVKNKRKSHLSHKNVRQLLQKSYQVDPNYETDLFSVLETTSNPPAVLSTPDKNPQSLLKTCQQKTEISRFGKEGLVSPPVLKQVKNKVLHEKYIDRLCSREAKRKAASLRAIKCSEKEGRKVGHDEKIDAIKAAKNALVFEARDAINQFRDIEANALDSNFFDEDEEEDEDGG